MAEKEEEVMYKRVKALYSRSKAGELNIDEGALLIYSKVLALYATREEKRRSLAAEIIEASEDRFPSLIEKSSNATERTSAFLESPVIKPQPPRPEAPKTPEKPLPTRGDTLSSIMNSLPRKYSSCPSVSSNIRKILACIISNKDGITLSEIYRESGVNKYAAFEYLNMLSRIKNGGVQKRKVGGDWLYTIST